MSNIEELANGVNKLKGEAKRIAATNDSHEQEILKKESRIKDLKKQEIALEKILKGIQSDIDTAQSTLGKRLKDVADLEAKIKEKELELESESLKVDEALVTENEALAEKNDKLKREEKERQSSVIALGKEQSKLKQYFSRLDTAING